MSKDKKPDRQRCADCGQRTDAGPCPGCGKVVCQLCAEREGEFCCDGEPADCGKEAGK